MNGITRCAVGRRSGVETTASQPIATACSASPATISGREPIRSLTAGPAIGATSIGMPVHGSVRRPASSGEQPCDDLEELGEQEDRAEDAEVHRERRRRWRPRRRASGRSASAASAPGARSSQATNAASSDRAGDQRAEHGAATSSRARRRGRCRRRCRAGRRRRAPGRAGRAARPGRRTRSGGGRPAGRATRPIGTLSQKIQCHEMPSTTAPPTSGPSATPRPEMPDQAPIARPRLLGRERVGEQRQRERGDDRGAGALHARAAISAPVLGRERGGGGGER